MVLEKSILVAVTGASGAIYAERLVQVLLDRISRIYLVSTNSGSSVMQHELSKNDDGISLLNIFQGTLNAKEKSVIRVFKQDDLFAPIASGSSVPDAMVVVPCSMGTMARIAQGISSNLLERAADVVLKQDKKLVICPRETPLNTIHLRNMLTLSEAGAKILPLMPAFYQKPKSIEDMVDFVIGRILEVLDLSHNLYPPWNKRMR